jgi:uncharacterized membrane protein
MAGSQPIRPKDSEIQERRSIKDRTLSSLWFYFRGWLFIAVAVFSINVLSKALSGVNRWLEPFIEAVSGVLGVAGVVVVLLIVPWIVSLLVELIRQRFRKRRGTRAYEQMERRLTRELRPDRSRGFRIAMVNWPNANVRTLAVVTATFHEPETERELASVFLPGTPDPTRGALRTVAVDDLTLTTWTLNDLIRYHVTFGSAAPDLADETED